MLGSLAQPAAGGLLRLLPPTSALLAAQWWHVPRQMQQCAAYSQPAAGGGGGEAELPPPSGPLVGIKVRQRCTWARGWLQRKQHCDANWTWLVLTPASPPPPPERLGQLPLLILLYHTSSPVQMAPLYCRSWTLARWWPATFAARCWPTLEPA